MIEQLDSRMKEMQAQQSRDLGLGTTAAELFFAIQCEGSIFQHRQILQRELVRLQKLRDDQQAVFHQARLERETIESVHDQQLRAYARERSRREQRQLDDLFLLRKAKPPSQGLPNQEQLPTSRTREWKTQ